MTNLKTVTEGYNKFCGPAVLSILTGRSTDDCANVIRSINGQYAVTGVLLTDLLKAAHKMGFTSETFSPQGSMYRTLTSLINRDGMYILTVSNHFVCIEVKDKKIYFCDNHTKEPIPAASSSRLMQQVLSVNRVIKFRDIVVPRIVKEINNKLDIPIYLDMYGKTVVGVHRIREYDDLSTKQDTICTFMLDSTEELKKVATAIISYLNAQRDEKI